MLLDPLPPGSTIGILGGGQLGRLLAVAAAKLGFQAAVYAPEEDSPAFQVCARQWTRRYDDDDAIADFARSCGVVTFEFENVPARALNVAAQYTAVRPNARSAAMTQDRIAEKAFITGLGFRTAPYMAIETSADLLGVSAFMEGAGPWILKRAREGYDGKGQARVKSPEEAEAAFRHFAAPCVLESVVDFAAEISVIAVRSPTGDVKCYDCPENTHRDGILSTSAVPASCAQPYQAMAKEIAARVAGALDYCGVLGVEFFVPREGAETSVIVNEIAPRVHNSGHWTLEACTISQFENHIRAIAGWPLGSTERHSDALMTNLLGEDALNSLDILRADDSASLYLYGKGEVRAGRKLGHVTRISPRKKNPA